MEDKTKCPIKKFFLPSIIAAAILLASIIAYLAVSFAIKNWNTSWLIIVGGVTIAVSVFCGFLISKFTKEDKYLIPRISLGVIIVLVFVLIYLCITILTQVSKSWIMFLIMIIALSGTDTVYAYWVNSKTRLFNILIFILVVSVLEYVVLSLIGLISWHPYWIIPVAGVLIDGIIIALKFKELFPKKSDNEITVAPAKADETDIEIASSEIVEEIDIAKETDKNE